MALKTVYRLVAFEAVDSKIANIIKQEVLSRDGDVVVAGNVGKFEETNTDIIIMGTMAQHIRLVRKLEEQSYGYCVQIASVLDDLLFKELDVDSTPAW
jgi:dihydropteroate synthase